GVTGDHLVRLVQVGHGEEHALELTPGHVELPGHAGAGGHDDRVEPGAQVDPGDVPADLHARTEPGALGGHLLDAPVDVHLGELEVRHPVAQQATDPVVPFVDGHGVPGTGELLGG